MSSIGAVPSEDAVSLPLFDRHLDARVANGLEVGIDRVAFVESKLTTLHFRFGKKMWDCGCRVALYV